MTAEERSRVLAFIRATCACQSCKDSAAEVLLQVFEVTE